MRGALLLVAAYGSIFSHDVPPKRFQSDDVTVTLRIVSETEVTRLCGDKMPPPPKGEYYEACTLANGVIVMPNSCHYLGQDYALTLCHETGHVLHWPGNHPK